MPELLPQIGQWANTLTVAGVLLAIIVAGYKRLWVWGWQYSEVQKDRDFWREAALHGKYMTERTVQLAETVADKAIRP